MSDADQIACAMWDVEEQRDALLAALKAVEWRPDVEERFRYCLLCYASPDDVHTPECLVGNAIAKAEGREQ